MNKDWLLVLEEGYAKPINQTPRNTAKHCGILPLKLGHKIKFRSNNTKQLRLFQTRQVAALISLSYSRLDHSECSNQDQGEELLLDKASIEGF